MKHTIIIAFFLLSLAHAQSSQVQSKLSNWNPACHGLLETSIESTLKLERTLKKKRKKLTQNAFNEKIQSELQVVQLNAWVCAVSSSQKLGASVEQEFLQEYARKVQQKNL